MRRLIMWNLITLDGMFDGPQPWELPFHQYAWGDELERFSLQQAEEVGALVFGRRTYEGMAAHWTTTTGEIADFMNAVPKYVASRTLKSADWANSTLINGDVAAAIRELKGREGKDLFVFGSADLSATLIREEFFDEYRFGLVSATQGDGRPLFAPDSPPLKLELVQARALGSRCLLMRYRPHLRSS